MTKFPLLAVVALGLGCGSKGGGSDVVAKLAELEKAMCACADEACAKKVADEHDKYVDSGVMKKPSDEQMKTVMDTERRIEACQAKYLLSEAATKQLDALKNDLAAAKKKVAAGTYTEAGFSCSESSLASFRKSYGAIADTKPEIKTFLDEYAAYCKEGMHLEAVTAVVTKAEAARAKTPEGSIPECSSPDITLAKVKLKDVAGATEKLAPLEERYAKACPR